MIILNFHFHSSCGSSCDNVQNYTDKYAGVLAHCFNQVININIEKEFLLRLN